MCRMDFGFDSFEEVISYFKRVINILKQMNYKEFHSEQFDNFEKELDELINERKI
jgi:V/A-type H+-transporting ATPase subunit A